MWYVYIIQKHNQFYTGITTSINNRLKQHNNPPLFYKEECIDKYKAAKREKQIKGFSRNKKLELIKKFALVSLS